MSSVTEQSLNAALPGAGAAGKKPHILVAEDDTAMRMALAYILTDKGYDVTAVCDGHEAINHLTYHPVQLALLDIKMPQVDGVRVLEQLRSNPNTQNLPVMILTGAASREIICRCVELKVAGFLVKQNLDMNDLIERMGKLLGTSNALADDIMAATAPPAAAAPPAPPAPRKDSAFAVTDADLDSIEHRDEAWVRDNVVSLDLPLLSEDHRKTLTAAMSDEPVDDAALTEALVQEPAAVVAFLQSDPKLAAGQFDQAILDWATTKPEGLMAALAEPAPELTPNAVHGLDVWHRHAVATQAVSRRLAQIAELDDPLLPAGALLQQVGRLLCLLSEAGADWVALSQRYEKTHLPLAAVEAQVLGMDHREVAEAWAKRPHLPGIGAEAARWSEVPTSQINEHRECAVCVITTAGRLATASGAPALDDAELIPSCPNLGPILAQAWHDESVMHAALSNDVPTEEDSQSLWGRKITIVGPRPNVFALAFAAEGAEVHVVDQPPADGAGDLLVIDQVSPGDGPPPPASADAPILVLKHRSDDTGEDAGDGVTVHFTPVTRTTLIHLVGQCAQ